MEIKWLKTFIVAARFENFRKASENLFLTQPAITKHIKGLEKQLEIQLFERVGKAVKLSEAGHRFLPYAKEIIGKYEQGLEDFELWKQGYHCKLVIAVAPQIASSVLPPILRTFMHENPNIEVIINILKSYEIGEEVNAGRADLGLTRIQPMQSAVNWQAIHEDPVVLVAPHTDEEEEKKLLQKYRLITHNHPTYWDHLLNDIKRHYPAVKTMTVTQIEITKRFIEQGLGVSYLPYSMVKDEISMKRLSVIKPDKIHSPTSTTYVLTKVITNETNLFLTFLKEAMVEK